MVKPDGYINLGKIIKAVEDDGFVISNLKMTKMTLADAEEFYAEHKGKQFFSELTNFMSSDLIVGLELVAENAVQKWRNLIGPTKIPEAKATAP